MGHSEDSRVTTGGGFDKSFPVESADFGVPFRHTLGTTFSFSLAVGNPIEGCIKLQGDFYSDKTVLLKGGGCEFCVKAKRAQEKGAKAVMVANTGDSGEVLVHITVGSCGQVGVCLFVLH